MTTIIQTSDGTDELRTVNERDWRVRVRVFEERAGTAPTNGEDVVITASDVSLIVSVALLDELGEVALDAAGRFMVFDGHTVTFQASALGLPSFDANAIIEAAISEQIASAESQLAGRESIDALMLKWGASERL